MTVRNVGAHLAEALESILAQTFGDFEVLVYDDGSTDGTVEIGRSFAARDSRILLHEQTRAGHARWAGGGIEAARAEYVARMDGDDISHPERFSKHLAYLRAHPECVAVGAEVLYVDPERRPIDEVGVQLDHDAIDRELMQGRGTALVQGAAMLRRSAVLAVGNYRTDFPWAEDLELFIRLAEHGRVANLPDTLLEYRQHAMSVNATRAMEQRDSVIRILREAHERRGLQGVDLPHLPSIERPLELVDLWTRWARRAIGGGRPATARHYAWRVLRTQPFAWSSWRLASRALLGVRLGWARCAQLRRRSGRWESGPREGPTGESMLQLDNASRPQRMRS